MCFFTFDRLTDRYRHQSQTYGRLRRSTATVANNIKSMVMREKKIRTYNLYTRVTHCRHSMADHYAVLSAHGDAMEEDDPLAMLSLAAAASAPVATVRSLMERIDSQEEQKRALFRQIDYLDAAIVDSKATIDSINALCDRVFVRGASLGDYIEAVRVASVADDVAFDPVNAEEQYHRLSMLPTNMPDDIAAFAFLPNNSVASAPMCRSTYDPITVFTVPNPLADKMYTFNGIDPRLATFYATADALYALFDRRLVFCNFHDGIMQEVEGDTAATFANGHVYFTKDTSIFKHNVHTASELFLTLPSSIKCLAMFGNKIAVLFHSQDCALYECVDAYNFNVLVPPFHCKGVVNVGVCDNKLVTAARSKVTTYGDQVIEHTTVKGQDFPSIISGNVCLAHTRQGSLIRYSFLPQPLGEAPPLATGVQHPTIHNNHLYYIVDKRLVQSKSI